VEKVFITDKEGKKLEMSVSDVVQKALKDKLGDGVALEADGTLSFTIKANGQVYRGKAAEVQKWASFGIHANERIREANAIQAEAKKVLDDHPRIVKQEAETIALQKVADIIDAIGRGLDPVTGRALTDDQRGDAERLRGGLQEHQTREEIRQLREELNRSKQEQEQRLRSQTTGALHVQAQGALETVTKPFTQHFMMPDGKTMNTPLYTLFKSHVKNETLRALSDERKRLGPGPEISIDWLSDTAKAVAQQAFKTLKSSIDAGVKGYVAAKGKPPVPVKPKPAPGAKPPVRPAAAAPSRGSLSFEEEVEMEMKLQGTRKP
jgi:hypothetical protein